MGLKQKIRMENNFKKNIEEKTDRKVSDEKQEKD